MTCPNCGTSNLDNATICVNCGKPLGSAPPPPPPPAQSYTPPPPASGGYTPAGAPAPPPGGAAPTIYLILSILLIVCCCNPLALIPLIFSIMAISRRNAGDYAGAAENTSKATLWFWVVFGIGVVIWIIWMVFMGGAAFMEGFREGMRS